MIHFLIKSSLPPTVMMCLASCFIVHRPHNTVGVVDKSVIISCAVDSGKDVVDWFYRSSTGKMMQLSRGFTILYQKFYNKMEIAYNYHNDTFVRYDLFIRRLNLGDTGTYCCSVISEMERSVHMAQLSMFVLDDCEASLQEDILVQKCRFRTTGRVLYVMSWYCTDTSRDSSASGTEEAKNLFMESIRVNVLIHSTVVRLSNEQNLTTCILDARTSEFAQHIIENYDNHIPNFDMTIFLMSKNPNYLIRSSLERCKVDMDGRLPLKAEAVFSDQYLQRNRILKEETAFMSYSCKRAPKTTAVIMRTNEDPLMNFVAAMSCEDRNALDCYQNFTYFIQPSSNMLYMNSRQYRTICSEKQKESARKCLEMSQPCKMTKKLRGIQESYDFLCHSNYDSISRPLPYVNSQHCFEHYPQVMGSIYGKKMSRPGIRDLPMHNATTMNQIFCRHMAAIAEIFCVEHLIAAVGNVDLSHWYLKFVGLLKQMDYYSLTPVYEGILKVPVFECEEQSSNVVARTLCFQSRNCTPMFSMLLQSITFGLIVVQNYRKLESEVCNRYDIELKSCLINFFDHCDINTLFIYRPMMALKEALCNRFKKSYQQHEGCFMKYYASSEIHQHCSWATGFYDLYAFQGSQHELSYEICKMGLQHINCVYKLVATACGREAAHLQKMLLKIIMKVAFDKLYCQSTFSLKPHLHSMKRVHSSTTLLQLDLTTIFISLINLMKLVDT